MFTYAIPPQKHKTSFDLTISITVNIYVTTTANGVLKLNPFCFKRKRRFTLAYKVLLCLNFGEYIIIRFVIYTHF